MPAQLYPQRKVVFWQYFPLGLENQLAPIRLMANFLDLPNLNKP
jgi:hypothetical protein